MSEAGTSLIGIVSLIILLAIVAVIVSKKTTTATVIQTFSTALDKLLQRETGKAT